jgi:DNA replication licensing factor MCM2
VPIDIEQHRGRLSEWIAQEQVGREVRRRFRLFLKTYQEKPEEVGGERVYQSRIRDMMSSECLRPGLNITNWLNIKASCKWRPATGRRWLRD